MGHDWREKELWRAKGLFNQRDLRPVDEAFARHDLRMLWTYFIDANNEQYAHPRDGSEVSQVESRFPTESQKSDWNLKIRTKAQEYLMQMPGHAQLFGDEIEELAQQEDTVALRVMRFRALGSLGSDECIQQLGRFLFDKRNPDKDGPRKYYRPPVANDVYAALWFQKALGAKSPLGQDITKISGSLLPPQREELCDWWLTSDAAAPYRRGLLDSGATLPPHYPSLPESRQSPPNSDIEGHAVNGWGVGAVLLILATISVWLAARRRKTA